VELATAAEDSLPRPVIEAAVAAVAPSGQALRQLALALAADPAALSRGAPPVAGRLAAELISRGSATLTVPACTACGRTGQPLLRGDHGSAVCQRCRAWQLAEPCATCGKVKPATGRDAAGQPVCEVCRRRDDPARRRRCGACGKMAPVAVRARDGQPDTCVNCYRLPEATCSKCQRRRPCFFAAVSQPVCPSCSPRGTACCARCGKDRPPAARWPEGPVCDPCYTAALRHRGACASCGQVRRLVAPPGPDADTCAGCAAIPVTHACADCGMEDKLYERGRCEQCALRRRARELLSAGTGAIPPQLTGVFEAICAGRVPRSALNWLRRSHGAALLARVASGDLPLTHEALDSEPRRRAADFLRHMLTAGGVLPPRDQELSRTNEWAHRVIETVEPAASRQVVRAYATWQVMRRLRVGAGRTTRPRTYTAHAHRNLRAAAGFLAWLHDHGRALTECGQADADAWLGTGPAASDVTDFLTWAARHGHCQAFTLPARVRATGPAVSQDQRWALAARLLHDNTLDLTDRAAGCLVLLYGQHLSRIAAMTTSQVTSRDDAVHVRFGDHDVPVPEPLGIILTELIRIGRTHAGTGSPTASPWLFPGMLPGQPITPLRLGMRLRTLGIYTMPGRRAALTDLAAQLPPAVLADLLNLAPTTAVRWTRQAGGDWSRYAAELARTRHHQP
jgi:hypothetical protein